MPISSFASLRLVEHLHLLEYALFMPGDDHLGDALAVFHHEILLRQIDEHHANLSTIVGIDGAGGVEHGDALLQGQSATGPHLGFVTCWQGDVQTRGYEPALQWAQRDGYAEVGPQIHARTLCRGILWQGVMPLVDDFYFQHLVKIIF